MNTSTTTKDAIEGEVEDNCLQATYNRHLSDGGEDEIIAREGRMQGIGTFDSICWSKHNLKVSIRACLKIKHEKLSPQSSDSNLSLHVLRLKHFINLLTKICCYPTGKTLKYNTFEYLVELFVRSSLSAGF